MHLVLRVGMVAVQQKRHPLEGDADRYWMETRGLGTFYRVGHAPVGVISIFLLASFGCKAGSRPHGFEVYDSASVLIAANTGRLPSEPLGWWVEAAPQISVGTSDGSTETTFFQVTDVQTLVDGRIAVANSGTSQVRLYSAEGQFVQDVGRDGAGPGEFGHLERVGATESGGWWTYDSGLHRVTEFRSSGGVVGTRQIASLPLGGREQLLADIRVLADGTIVGIDWSDMSDGPTPSISLDTAFWAAVEADGSSREVAHIPGALTTHFERGSRRMFRTLPLTNFPSWDVYEDHLYFTSGAAYEVRVADLDGNLVRIFRRDGVRAPVGDEAIDVWKNYIRRSVPGGPDDVEPFLAAVPFADSLAVYSSLIVDPLGFVWLERGRPTGIRPNPAWEVLSPDGEFLGVVGVRPDFRVHEIGVGHVLGIWVDSVDVEYLHRYRLHRDPAGGGS